MATESQAPPNSMEDNKQQQTPGVTQAANNNDHPQLPSTTPSVFVNSQPLREDQIQNAMKFLSHPKVRGSPVMYRRSFLENKGLTREEIDEAFRRVPDPSPSAQAPSTTQDGQARPSNTQIQATTQIPQAPGVTAPGAMVSVGPSLWSRLHWYHAIIAVGVLAVSGAGSAVLFKKSIIPRLKSWIRKVVMEEENNVKEIDGKPSLAEEAAAAAKSAAAAAADVAKASQEMLNSKNDEKRYFQELMNLLDVQVKEMRSMGNAIQRLEGADNRGPAPSSNQPYTNGTVEHDSRSAGFSSPPANVEPSAAPHSKSYMEIMEMVQRGERPPNVRDINDMPPNPNQQPSNPRLGPRAKPWEAAQAQNGSSQVLQSQVSGEGVNSVLSSYQRDVDNSVPWYRKSAHLTEIEKEFEPKSAPYNVQPRTWVPPQPPPVAMAEAAEAIRRPKSAAKKEQAADSSEGMGELERITAISESGGAVKTNGSSSGVEINGNGLSSSEIVEEQVYE
ncbi:hypothetical protein ACFE04_027214 [Oxalis oulophora]